MMGFIRYPVGGFGSRNEVVRRRVLVRFLDDELYIEYLSAYLCVLDLQYTTFFFLESSMVVQRSMKSEICYQRLTESTDVDWTQTEALRSSVDQ